MKNGQSVIEYTLLIITVAAAFVAMSVYLQRAANDRLHSIELETNPGIIVEGPNLPASTGPAAGGTGGPGLPVPSGWEYVAATGQYCHTATGKCYSEDWMRSQQTTGSDVVPEVDEGERGGMAPANPDIDIGEK